MSEGFSRLDYVTCIRADDRPALIAALERATAAVVVLAGDTVADAAGLFAAVADQLGLEPNMQPHSWDALTDALFEVAVRAGSETVAFVWDDADVLATSDLQDFVTATSVLDTVAVSATQSRDIDLRAFLLGATDAFRPISAYQALS